MNCARIREKMKTDGLDAVLLLSIQNMRYATGFSFTDGAVLITKDDAYLFTDSRYIEAANAQVKDAKVIMFDGTVRLNDWLLRTLTEHGCKRIGAEEGSLPYGRWKELEEKLGCTLYPAQHLLGELRAIKQQYEVDSMIEAQRIAERALDDVLGMIKPGMKERDIAAELTYRMLLGGAEGNSFDPICITGAKTSMPHGVPGDEVVKAGDFVTMDFGCLKNGYCSDMTRTVAVGSATDEMKKVYATVLEAQLAGIAAARPGATGFEVHSAAAKVIADAGYGQYFGHGFGHSVGLDIHEAPNANLANKSPLPAGAVVTAEPGIYIPGKFGVRIEDMLYLTGDGCVNLTKAPKQLIIL